MIVESYIQAKKYISCLPSLNVCVLTRGLKGRGGEYVKISQNVAIGSIALLFEVAGNLNSFRIAFANLFLECVSCL